ncbi:hypothetical protein ACVXHA_24335 [Escherichia coli]
MLNAVGAQSLNALTGQIVPKDIQLATRRRLAHRRPNTPHWQNSRLLPVAINAHVLHRHGLHRRAATAGYPA